MLRRELILSVLAMSITVTAAEKAHDWQTGTLLDTDRNRYFAGTYTPSTVNGPGTFGYPLYRFVQDYVIDAGVYIYVAEERIRPKSKRVNLIVNTSVKFAVEKRRLFVIDNDGKTHEAQIVKQILKQ